MQLDWTYRVKLHESGEPMNPMLPNGYDYLYLLAVLGSLLTLITPVALILILIEVRKIRKALDRKDHASDTD